MYNLLKLSSLCFPTSKINHYSWGFRAAEVALRSRHRHASLTLEFLLLKAVTDSRIVCWFPHVCYGMCAPVCAHGRTLKHTRPTVSCPDKTDCLGLDSALDGGQCLAVGIVSHSSAGNRSFVDHQNLHLASIS